MQKLHLVGFTTELDGLIFSTRKGAKSGSYVVPLTADLLRAVAESERLRNGADEPAAELEAAPGDAPGGVVTEPPRPALPVSQLSPREMQDRLRAGRTVEEVAAEAQADTDWVDRFAAPILAEQSRVVGRARQLVFDKPRVGRSTLSLGAAVRRNVAERGVRLADDELDDAWGAYHLDGSLWVVRFRYRSRGRPQEAEWLVDLDTDELTSRNRLASQLGYTGSGRRRTASRPAAKGRKAAARTRAAKPAAGKAATRQTTARTATRKPAARKATGRPPRKASSAAAAARAAGSRKRPAKKPKGAPPGATAPPPPRPVRPVVSARPAVAPPAPAVPPPPAPVVPARPAPPVVAATGTHGPLPPPAPLPVPTTVREAVASPIGEAPDVDGVLGGSEEGVAVIRSRRASGDPAGPGPVGHRPPPVAPRLPPDPPLDPPAGPE